MSKAPVEISPGITVHPDIGFGKPVVRGTRITIDLIMDQLAAGASYEQIEDAFGISRQSILDVLRYAAEIISQEVVVARAR